MEQMYIKAQNGIEIPQLGFGVYKINEQSEFENVIEEAIKVGYRHFDTAKIYGNEEFLGQAIRKSNIPREEFFITSKVWTTDLGYKETLRAFEQSCRKLQVDYLDMYLIHFAGPHFLESWKALEEMYRAKKIRVIGVANFEIKQLEKLMKYSKIPPMINQIETHPEFPQNELHNYMLQNQIIHAAWAPLGQGNKKLFDNVILKNIAQQYGKTVAQIILRWHLERGIVIIPKSSNPKRINENSQLFDFNLSIEDMGKIEHLNTGNRYSHSPTGYMINPVYIKLMKLFVK